MSPRSVPRVTIGVPAYNAERYLAETVASLTTQSYEDIEIVICDNASTDRTPEIARDLATTDPRVRHVRNPENLGAGGNFIRCVQVARGELFRWNSADDLSAPTFVERCVDVLDAEPDVVQAYPRAILIDEDGNELEKYEETIEALHERPRDRYMHVMRNLGLVNAFYGVMRTDLLRRTRIHGSYVGADEVIQAEIALYGKLREIPEYLFFRRMHRDAHSAMSQEQKQAFYTPGKSKKVAFRNWRHLKERLSSVARSPLDPGEKAALCGAILRDAVASRDQFGRELTRGAAALLGRAR